MTAPAMAGVAGPVLGASVCELAQSCSNLGRRCCYRLCFTGEEKWRRREVRLPVQGCTAGKWLIWDSHSAVWPPRPHTLTTVFLMAWKPSPLPTLPWSGRTVLVPLSLGTTSGARQEGPGLQKWLSRIKCWAEKQCFGGQWDCLLSFAGINDKHLYSYRNTDS